MNGDGDVWNVVVEKIREIYKKATDIYVPYVENFNKIMKEIGYKTNEDPGFAAKEFPFETFNFKACSTMTGKENFDNFIAKTYKSIVDAKQKSIGCTITVGGYAFGIYRGTEVMCVYDTHTGSLQMFESLDELIRILKSPNYGEIYNTFCTLQKVDGHLSCSSVFFSQQEKKTLVQEMTEMKYANNDCQVLSQTEEKERLEKERLMLVEKEHEEMLKMFVRENQERELLEKERLMLVEKEHEEILKMLERENKEREKLEKEQTDIIKMLLRENKERE